MISMYEIGDTVILRGTVKRIEVTQDGEIIYYMQEYQVPVGEETIVGRVEEPWKLTKQRQDL